MGNLLNRDEVSCRRFLDALEELPLSGNTRKSAEEWRAGRPEAEEKHAGSCGACRKEREERAERREAPAGRTGRKAEPRCARRERGSRSAGAGVGVGVGGGWGVEVRKADRLNADRGSGDMVFDSSVAATRYDDGVGATSEVRP